MTPEECEAIEAFVEQHNNKPLSDLERIVLKQDGPNWDYPTVLSNLVDAVRAGSRKLGVADMNPQPKDVVAVAWASVAATLKPGMAQQVLNQPESIEWADDLIPIVLTEIRHLVRQGTIENLKWAFRDAYQRHMHNKKTVVGLPHGARATIETQTSKPD